MCADCELTVLPPNYGFIIVRHVRNQTNDFYWKEAYNSVRWLYPRHKIVIIDDNSSKQFLKSDILCTNTIFIESEFPGRGELLPYYYYLKNGKSWGFDKAVIIHDSVFIHKKINLQCGDTYRMIWDFKCHNWDNPEIERKMIQTLTNHEDILKLYDDTKKWNGCFGIMTIISRDFLEKIDAIHNLSNLNDVMITKEDRCGLERVMSCILKSHDPVPKPILGDINEYMEKITFDEYKSGKYDEKLPIIKVWSGR